MAKNNPAFLRFREPKRWVANFTAFQKLLILQESEQNIDFNLANLEQAALVEEIDHKGGREEFLGRELR